MIKRSILAAALALFLTLPAQAQARDCYSAREFEAEQGLRIHSELMVIGLTCARAPGGAGLYGGYQMFTRKNQRLILSYESDLIAFFQQQGKLNPERELHSLRTRLANQISQNAVKMQTASFCKRFAPRIQQALAMSEDKLRRWAQQVWTGAPTLRPVCAILPAE